MDTVSVLLLDDDHAFAALFKEYLLENAKDHLNIKITRIESFNPSEISKPFDVYFVEHKLYGKPISVEVVEKWKKINFTVKIFIISKYGDFNLFKDFTQCVINGFIDN